MKQGFSQIELLIVVAIAAIVTAAAIPNFLEAQTRAKVSRSKSDLWSIAVAVEAYVVDFNKVPPDGNDDNGMPRTTVAGELQRTTDIFPTCTPGVFSNSLVARCYSFRTFQSWTMLTTPIGYLPRVYADAFSEFVPYAHYDQATSVTNPPFCMLLSCGPDRTISNDSMQIGEPAGIFSSSVGGSLISGPSIPSTLARALNNVYDPSNGTISYGEIYRLCAIRNLNDFYSFSPNNENGHGFGFPLTMP